jgi:1-deoxy-D-xylulose-5-phosphate reductoisomerase
MGAKITVDSATMLNKAFEIIEARWLFDITPDRIKAVVHPQSIVHSMVEFIDGSVKAQLGLPDMHIPIRYALGDATRLTSSRPRLNITDYAHLDFYEPDTDKFPLLKLAHYALERGGNVACVINAANEVAVAAFLKEQIKYLDIQRIIYTALEVMPYIANPTYEDYVNTNLETRRYAQTLI